MGARPYGQCVRKNGKRRTKRAGDADQSTAKRQSQRSSKGSRHKIVLASAYGVFWRPGRKAQRRSTAARIRPHAAKGRWPQERKARGQGYRIWGKDIFARPLRLAFKKWGSGASRPQRGVRGQSPPVSLTASAPRPAPAPKSPHSSPPTSHRSPDPDASAPAPSVSGSAPAGFPACPGTPGPA